MDSLLHAWPRRQCYILHTTYGAAPSFRLYGLLACWLVGRPRDDDDDGAAAAGDVE